MIRTTLAAVLAALALVPGAACAGDAVLTVPFDFSRSAIGLDVSVKGQKLHMLLDTGVDPSAIDIKRADALGLPIDRLSGGEASGEGDAASAQIYPATIDGLTIGGRAFHAVDAAAMDMSALSAHYGRPLDGILGFSFLTDRIVLVDYPHGTLSIVASTADAVPLVRMCVRHFSIPLRAYAGDESPLIPDFRFGAATTSITLDTGSNKGITLFQGAFDLPGLRAALTQQGEVGVTGARGNATWKTYVLNEAVGFGPFSLPPGQIVSASPVAGSADTRLANLGNPIFAAMHLKMLLDYRARQMTFYGSCRQS